MNNFDNSGQCPLDMVALLQVCGVLYTTDDSSLKNDNTAESTT